jgi:hypothetical protein
MVATRDDIINKIEHALAYEDKVGKSLMINASKLPIISRSSISAVDYYCTQLTETNQGIVTLINEIEARVASKKFDFETLPKFIVPTRKYDAQSTDISLLADDAESHINNMALNGSKVLRNDESMWINPEPDMHSSKDLESDMVKSNTSNDAVLSRRNNFQTTFQDVKANTTSGLQALTSHAKIVSSGTNLVTSGAINLANSGLNLLKGLDEGAYFDSGFISFTNLATTNAALQMLHHEKPFDMEVHHAPDPEDSKFLTFVISF